MPDHSMSEISTVTALASAHRVNTVDEESRGPHIRIPPGNKSGNKMVRQFQRSYNPDARSRVQAERRESQPMRRLDMQNQPRGWWLNFPLRTGYRVLDYLLLAVPVVFILDQVSSEPLLLFGVAAVAIVPLAASLGTATEELSVHVGQRLGGLLNATLGNATELILGIFMVRAHQIDVVKPRFRAASSEMPCWSSV